jgi:TolB-like protein
MSLPTSFGQRAILTVIAYAVSGCASNSIQSTEWQLTGLAPVRSIAVARFTNLTTQAKAGDTVTAALTSELRRRAEFQIIEVSGASMERWSSAKVAKDVKADAVLVGVVTAFEYRPGAQPGGATQIPTVAIDVRLISGTGEILWAAGLERNRNQVASYDGVPLEELTQDVVEQVADALAALLENG